MFLITRISDKIAEKSCQALRKFPTNTNITKSSPLFQKREEFTKFITKNMIPPKYDQEEKVNMKILKSLLEFGLFNCDKKYGGMGLSIREAAFLFEPLPFYDLSVAIMFGVQQTLAVKPLMNFGSDFLKDKYLPKFAKTEVYGCFCLTENEAGSDPMSIQTKAVFCPESNSYILNGDKLWITNGDISDIFTVFAKVLNPKTNNEELTAFLVEKNFGGIEIGENPSMLGIKCAHSVPISFRNVKVPVENIIGEIGQGFKIAVNSLNYGRFFLGVAMKSAIKRIINISLEYASEKDKDDPIFEYRNLQCHIKEMSTSVYYIDTLLHYTGYLIDNPIRSFSTEAGLLKIFSTESAWKSVDKAFEIFGNDAIVPPMRIEKLLRDLRIFRIIEGTNCVLNQFVANNINNNKMPFPRTNSIVKYSLKNYENFFKDSDYYYDFQVSQIAQKILLNRLVEKRNKKLNSDNKIRSIISQFYFEGPYTKEYDLNQSTVEDIDYLYEILLKNQGELEIWDELYH